MKQSETATRGRKKAVTGSSQNKTAGQQPRARWQNTGRGNSGRQASAVDSSASAKSNHKNVNRNPGSSKNSNPSASKAQQSRTGSSGRTSSFDGNSHLEKFFLDQLQDIYCAEHKIIESLPKMAEATTTEELQEAFEDHLHQTQRHVKRLEKAFEILGQQASGKKCEAIEGIAREVDSIIGETVEGSMTRDAALILAAQKVEHYEIATYGGLLQLAITMGQYEVAELLDRTLIEEEDTDALLTDIAECDINLLAEHEGNEFALEEAGGAESSEHEGEEGGEEKETEQKDSEANEG